jgi:hypothetical protein
MLCCSWAICFSAAPSSENDHGSINLALKTAPAPMRIFFRLGLLLVAIGMAYGVYISLEQRLGFPVAGMLVATLGALLCMLGLIADQISQFWLMQLGSSNLGTSVPRPPLSLDRQGEPATHHPVQEDRS